MLADCLVNWSTRIWCASFEITELNRGGGTGRQRDGQDRWSFVASYPLPFFLNVTMFHGHPSIRKIPVLAPLFCTDNLAGYSQRQASFCQLVYEDAPQVLNTPYLKSRKSIGEGELADVMDKIDEAM